MSEPERRWAIFGTLLFPREDDVSEPIVTFRKAITARQYIDKNRLKRRASYGREFRADSYLSAYKEVYIDLYKVEHPPHIE